MGISFSARCGDELQICFSYAVYHHSEQQTEENNKIVNKHFYTRNAKKFVTNISVPDKVCYMSISKEPDILMYFHIRKINTDGSVLATVSVINRHSSVNDIISNSINALFQCEISVKNQKGFIPIYQRNIHKAFEDEKNDMLYDSIDNYSYGHGCSSVHCVENNIVNEIKSEFIPQYRMLQMMPRLFSDIDCLYMKYWKNADRKTACKIRKNFQIALTRMVLCAILYINRYVQYVGRSAP